MPIDKRINLKMEKTYYQQNFGIGQFLFVTLGAGAFIDKGQTEEEVWNELKLRTHEHFQKGNFFLPQENTVTIAQQPEPSILPEIQVEKPIGRSMVEMINSCDELKILDSYHLLVRNNLEWNNAYNERRDYLLSQVEIDNKTPTKKPITNGK